MGLFSFESKQVKEWKKLAKSGDMEAQYHLGGHMRMEKVQV